MNTSDNEQVSAYKSQPSLTHANMKLWDYRIMFNFKHKSVQSGSCVHFQKRSQRRMSLFLEDLCCCCFLSPLSPRWESLDVEGCLPSSRYDCLLVHISITDTNILDSSIINLLQFQSYVMDTFQGDWGCHNGLSNVRGIRDIWHTFKLLDALCFPFSHKLYQNKNFRIRNSFLILKL